MRIRIDIYMLSVRVLYRHNTQIISFAAGWFTGRPDSEAYTAAAAAIPYTPSFLAGSMIYDP